MTFNDGGNKYHQLTTTLIYARILKVLTPFSCQLPQSSFFYLFLMQQTVYFKLAEKTKSLDKGLLCYTHCLAVSIEESAESSNPK